MRFLIVLTFLFSSSAFANDDCPKSLQSHILSAETEDFWSTLDHLEQMAVIGRIEKFLALNPVDTAEGRKAFREMMKQILTGAILADDETPWISGFLNELARDPKTLLDVAERLDAAAKSLIATTSK